MDVSPSLVGVCRQFQFDGLAAHQGEKATRCHVCFLVGDSWKVFWNQGDLVSAAIPKFDSSGRGHHKPHHKLLYSGGVKSDAVWPFSLAELRPKKVAILNFSLLSCKVFTFQHISTKPWKITFLNYTLTWLYNLHIYIYTYIHYTSPWNNRKLTWKPKLDPYPWKKRFGSLDSSRGTVARRAALRLQRRKCWVTSVGETQNFQILHHQPKLGGDFQRFFVFTSTWGNDPNWLIFFNWVETTN